MLDFRIFKMTKKQVIQAIEHAQEYHLAQMEKVAQLVRGEKVKNPTPRMKDECEFGQWIYGDASHTKTLLGIQFYKSMEVIHEFWHLTYEKIYDIYYIEDKEGLFTKFLPLRRKLPQEEYELVQKYYHDLEQATEDLLEALTASKRRILALKERVFTSID